MRPPKPRATTRSSKKAANPKWQITELSEKLNEMESILQAIRGGEVEALVVQSTEGDRIFRLQGADDSYRHFLEVMSEGAVTVTAEGIILYCNKRFSEMIQSGTAELIGNSFEKYLAKNDAKNFEALLRSGQEENSKSDFTLKRNDESLLPVRLSMAPLTGNAHQKSVCMVVTDMSDQKRAEERLQSLSHRLLEVQENEKRHLARELHDEIGQFLTGLKMTLETSSLLSGAGKSQILDEAREQVSALLSRIQDISLDLRPGMLDDLGLLPTILWHLQRYESQTQIKVVLQHNCISNTRFDPQVETTAYRIIQEALTNVARHSGAREARVQVRIDAGLMLVDIEDLGKGFHVQKAMRSGTSSGLTGMQERAALLGGELGITSKTGKGTRVWARLPVKVSVKKP